MVSPESGSGGDVSASAGTSSERQPASVVAHRGEGEPPRTRQPDADFVRTVKRILEDRSDDGSESTIRHWLASIRFPFYWTIGAALLAIPLALSRTTFANSSIGDLPLFAFFYWLEIVWAGLLGAYFFAQMIARTWEWLFQENILNIENYSYLVSDVQVALVFLLWAFVAWLMRSVMCRFGDGNCADEWIDVLSTVLLASLAVAGIFQIKSLLVALVLNNSARTYLKPNQSILRGCSELLFMLLHTGVESAKDETQQQTPANPPVLPLHRTVQRPPSRMLAILCHILKKLRRIFIKDSGPEIMAEIVYQKLSSKNPAEKDIALKLYFWSYFYENPLSLDCPEFITVAELESRLERARGVEVIKKKATKQDKLTKVKDLVELLTKHRDKTVTYREIGVFVTELQSCSRTLVEGEKHIEAVVRSLNTVLTVICLVGAGLIYAAFFDNSALTSNLNVIWVAFTGLGFAIGPSLAEFLAAGVFVFAKHPYDVGDRVWIGDRELLVDEICLTYSRFKCVNTGRLTQYAHAKVNESWIDNSSRSSEMKDVIEVPYELGAVVDVHGLRERLQAYINTTNVLPFYRYYKPNISLERVSSGEKVKLRLVLRHRERLPGCDEAIVHHCRQLISDEFFKYLQEGRQISDPPESDGEEAAPEDRTGSLQSDREVLKKKYPDLQIYTPPGPADTVETSPDVPMGQPRPSTRPAAPGNGGASG